MLAKPEPDTEPYVSTHPKHQRLFIELRPKRSRFFQARTYLDGKLHQTSLKTDHLPTAQRLGEDWYKKKLRASVSEGNRHPLSKLALDPTMAELCASYKSELPKSKQTYLAMKWGPIAQFWRTIDVAEVTTPKLKEFVKWRRRHRTKEGEPVKAHTIHKDLIAVRQILKYAIEEGHITQLPLFPKAGQIESNPRLWLTPAEWSTLKEVSRLRIQDAKTKTVRHYRQELDDEMRWFVASMMRISDVIASDNPPAPGLRFRDCRIVKNAKGDAFCCARCAERSTLVMWSPRLLPLRFTNAG